MSTIIAHLLHPNIPKTISNNKAILLPQVSKVSLCTMLESVTKLHTKTKCKRLQEKASHFLRLKNI